MAEVLNRLREDLKAQEEADKELATEPGMEAAQQELTEEEKERIEKMRTESGLALKEEGEDGKIVTTDASEFAKPLDDKIANVAKTEDEQDLIKMINSGDIVKTAEQIKTEARATAVKAFRELAVTNDEVDEDTMISVNNKAIKMLQEHFNMDRLDSDVLIKKLRKLDLKGICELLPPEFVSMFVTDNERAVNNIKAKERVIASIAYLCATGPELDYLNEYIETENILSVVSSRLLKCKMDFAEMLKDEKSISEMVAETTKISPMDDSFWASYIKLPDRVHNEFAQRVVIFTKYKEAYEKLMEEYKDNDRATALIQEEIDECDQKIEVYTSICDMTLLKSLWEVLVDRLKENKKTNMKFIMNEGLSAVDRIRRSKQNVPFPSYNGKDKKPDLIYQGYLTAFPKMVERYNQEVANAIALGENNDAPKRDVGLITLEGYKDSDTHLVFGMLLAILMGRVMKALTKNDMTKYDAITLDAYFQLFCKMGTDVYIMRDIWSLMKDFVQYTLDHYYKK